jgi:hypothetical protein
MAAGELPNFTIVPFRKSNTALEYNWIISGEEDEDEEEDDGPPATSPSMSTDDACCVRVVKSVNAMVEVQTNAVLLSPYEFPQKIKARSTTQENLLRNDDNASGPFA